MNNRKFFLSKILLMKGGEVFSLVLISPRERAWKIFKSFTCFTLLNFNSSPSLSQPTKVLNNSMETIFTSAQWRTTEILQTVEPGVECRDKDDYPQVSYPSNWKMIESRVESQAMNERDLVCSISALTSELKRHFLSFSFFISPFLFSTPLRE